MNDEIMNSILNKIGFIVVARAVELCPVDMGTLRQSIRHKVEGNKVTIYTDVEYAEDMEYGKSPEPLSESEKENLKGWAKRHNLPSGPVISKIEKRGIKVGTPDNPMKTSSGFRPFLRPAVHQSIPQIKTMIKEALS
jgi:hypothetical protein